MYLTKTSEYAIRVLCFMATDESAMYTAKQMVKQLRISDKYLRRILTRLSKEGLIRSIQGRDGGYLFAKPTHQIFLINIIDAIEESDKYMGCFLGFSECSDKNPCAIHHKWEIARKPIMEMFTTTSLNEIIEEDFTKRF